MKQLSVVFMFLIVYGFSLFSCVGVQPITIVQESVNSSPLQPKVVTTAKATVTIDLSCQAVEQGVGINDEGEIISLGEVTCVNSPPLTTAVPTVQKLSAEEQVAVATALAYLGDKAPYLKVDSVGDRSVPGYIIRFRQVYQGIPIEEGKMIIVIAPEQPPRISLNDYYEGVNIPSITPTLSLEDAVEKAVHTLGITDSYKISTNFRSLRIIKVPTKNPAKKGTKTPVEDKPQKYGNHSAPLVQ